MAGPTEPGRYRDANYTTTRTGPTVPPGQLETVKGLRRPIALELARQWAREGWDVVVTYHVGSTRTETIAQAAAHAQRLTYLQ
jgi:hypothetical protein